jgi:2-succinyl-6-hydroxy-2,4-cyclohexadiene-1-carboxylate synthase
VSRTLSDGLQWNTEWCGAEGAPILVLLHGFAGSVRTWDSIADDLAPCCRLLSVDLPGHGASAIPATPISLSGLGAQIAVFLQELASGSSVLGGYSMGGRVALHIALHSPASVRALVLVGVSPGIADVTERAARREADRQLASQIREKGITWFADYWPNLPLFESQKHLPSDIQAQLRRQRLSCDAEGLAYALENFGTGTQEDLRARLKEITCPVLLLAGQRDSKFCEIHREVVPLFGSPHVLRVEIPDAGHAAHIERPRDVAHAIRSFLETL